VAYWRFDMNRALPTEPEEQPPYGPAPGERTWALGRLRASGPWSQSGSHRRLRGRLAAYRLQLDAVDEVTGAERLPRLEPLLDAAEAALTEGDVDRAWACFHAAVEVELLADALGGDGRLDDWAELLAAETTKLDSAWRRAAATALLESGDAHALYHVRRLLDEQYDNMWRQLRTFRRYLGALATLSLLFVVSVVAVDALGGPLLPDVGTSLFVAVALFGGLGATVSAALSAGRDSTRNPERLVDAWVGLARVAVGMAAALALFVFLHSGVVSLGPLSSALALAVAFVAGFSDRLLVRTVGTVVEPDDGADGS
jgi:hypothetical protein